MDPELQAYLDEWEARRRRDFADCMASLDALQRAMDTTVSCVTAPVTATVEPDLAPAGLVEPSTPVPAIGEPPTIAHAAPIDSFDVVPASFTVSTTTTPLLWASRSTNNSVLASSNTDKIATTSAGLAEPPALVPPTEKSLMVAQDVPNATSTRAPTFCSTECPSHDITKPRPAFTPSAVATLPTTTVEVSPLLTATASSDTIESLLIFASHTIESLLIFASHTIDMPLSSSWHQDHMHYHTPWPPPYLCLSWSDSSKIRPIPWPSLADLSGGVHLIELRPLLQGTSGEFSMPVLAVIHHFPDGLSGPLHICFCLQYEVYCEEQFNSRGVSINLSENFLKKQWVESNAAIWIGLIRRATRALNLWCIPWFSIALPLFCRLFWVDSGVLSKWASLPLVVFLGVLARQPLAKQIYILDLEELGDINLTVFVFMKDMLRRGMCNSVEFIQSNLSQWLYIVFHILKLMEEMQQLLSDVLHSEFLQYMAETSGDTFVLIIWSEKNIVFLMWATTVNSDYTFQLISGHVLWTFIETVHGLALEVLPFSECTNLNLTLASYEMVWKIAWFFIVVCSSSDNMKMDDNEGLSIRFHRVPRLALLGSTCKLFSGGTNQACKVQSYMTFSYSDRRQEDIYFRVGHLPFYSSFHMRTGMRMEKSMGNGEVNQRLVNFLRNEYFFNNAHALALSSIMQPSWSSKRGLQVITGIFFWVPTDLDGEADQHWYISWDPGGGRLLASSFSRREKYHKSRCLLLQVHIDHDYKPIYNDLRYYCKAYHEDCNKIMEVHAPWDPGKETLQNPLKLRLGDKPSFKEGGMLGPSAAFSSSWAGVVVRNMGSAQLMHLGSTYTHQGEWTHYPEGSRRHGTAALLPPWLYSSFLFMLVHLFSQ